MDEKGGNDGFLPLSGILASLADRTRPCFGRTRLHPGGKEGQKGGTAKTQMGQKEQQVDRPQILEQPARCDWHIRNATNRCAPDARQRTDK